MRRRTGVICLSICRMYLVELKRDEHDLFGVRDGRPEHEHMSVPGGMRIQAATLSRDLKAVGGHSQNC